jgi:hypothetical protein
MLGSNHDTHPHCNAGFFIMEDCEMKRLFYCQANGVFGQFGDYVWAANKKDALNVFELQFGYSPTRIRKA